MKINFENKKSNNIFRYSIIRNFEISVILHLLIPNVDPHPFVVNFVNFESFVKFVNFVIFLICKFSNFCKFVNFIGMRVKT